MEVVQKICVTRAIGPGATHPLSVRALASRRPMEEPQAQEPHTSEQPQGRRWGLYAVAAAVIGVFLLAVIGPIFAASVTVKGDPVVNSGTDSALTFTSTLFNSGHINRFNGVTFTVSGTSITAVGFQGSKSSTATNDSSVIKATLQDSAGGTLKTATTTLSTGSGSFAVTSTIASAFPTYQRVAKVVVGLTETLKTTKDATIRSAVANTNFGAATTLSVAATSPIDRALLGFDLSNVGTNGLQSATLTLTVAATATWTNGHTLTVQAFNLTSPGSAWTQGACTGSSCAGSGVTWNNAVDSNTNNTSDNIGKTGRPTAVFQMSAAPLPRRSIRARTRLPARRSALM